MSERVATKELCPLSTFHGSKSWTEPCLGYLELGKLGLVLRTGQY